MAQAFLRMAHDAGLRRSLAEHAAAEAENKHSIDAVAGAYQALYDNAS
jgi:glycosyltransferase involved in cell wall biosynthesis